MDDIPLRERRGEVLRLGRVHEDVDVPAHRAGVIQDARGDGAEGRERLAQGRRVHVQMRGPAGKRAEGGGEPDADTGHEGRREP